MLIRFFRSLNWSRKVARRRRGFTMIETVACVAILGLLTIAMGRVSMIKLNNQDSIDRQYSVLAADSFMADIYKDFHEAISYDFIESPAGQRMLTFVKADGTSSVYSLDPTSGGCYKDGVWQFAATQFEVVGTTENLTVSIKLPNERLLDYSIYR